MASSSSSCCYSLTQPRQFDYIFVNLPPLLRFAYNKMRDEWQYLVKSVKYETQLRDKEQKQAAADELFLEMRKLCVDPKLLKSGIKPRPVNALFETIHDVAPNLLCEQYFHKFHRKMCAKCGDENNVLATSCLHLLSIGCVSDLWMWNDSLSKKLSCYVCNNDIEAEDIWSPYDTKSKIDTMVTLLKEDQTHKVIVFCEFVETLGRLEFGLRSNNMKGWCCFENMNGTINANLIHRFQNRDDVNILLVDLRLMDDLEGFDLSCVTNVYLMNGCPATTEQKVVSLVTKQKNEVKFVTLLARDTVDLMGTKFFVVQIRY